MLDYSRAGFSFPLTCKHNPGVEDLVSATRAVPFQWGMYVASIGVVGIPAIRC